VSTTDAYQTIAQAYADGVRALLARRGVGGAERSVGGQLPTVELAERAEQLVPVSANLTRAAADRLGDADPTVRIQSSAQLLAKALIDLEITSRLLEAAMDEGAPAGADIERSASGSAFEERLAIVLGLAPPATAAKERSDTRHQSLAAAREALGDAVEDALTSITERASAAAQIALSGLLGLSTAELAGAIGAIGTDIAQLLGQAEAVSRLYSLVRSFIAGVYASLMALVNAQVIEAAAGQLVAWVNDMREGKQFGEFLARFYATEQTRTTLHALISSSQATREQFTDATQKVEALAAAFRQQIELSEKLLKGFRFVGAISAAILPQGELLLSAAYAVIGAYVVFVGGDYLDAPRVQYLDRVPGLPQLVVANLPDKP